MVKRPYFRLGIGLIVVGAAFIALNIWLFTTVHLDLVPTRGKLALGAIGLTMLITGTMVLLGF
jgi:hypothetical protein